MSLIYGMRELDLPGAWTQGINKSQTLQKQIKENNNV
ncbi:hypothetical protein PP914_gp117 [Arthrobacter phage Qui]|uniref:Uncharacterized protein n=1 Tax=Arthrobacter phage Qui TaxID=2603260 RepID=A0A5B8WIY7_9CAUD|nr:hypothetical protein PP914_gp117 [Arthrobacter phage Qui]QED11737.1 hypothetical protein SEA_QUI_117 [Arthrobacter phage Qui]